ncbi:indolepyruvate oxidoreductase [Desulfosarcina ovata subsp. sediminis]|uniref:Indolepyruvate oxidoreductase subunit IorA n=1 Tax=Desulfosarcina ovata subsp. sediminis TaxID=885957 RepID=A0A5K7ZVD4_9BACT|nr:thiamine pyrophosphate-dependent enzyme [Desulfosarcina ovata]BBO84197.1 indolepyruvate oxidoreductase [Desulfosarcina ovata subsp. sediminis]
MSIITGNQNKAERPLMMGNEAIARGALEAGVKVVAAYPGTPSSEIPKTLGDVADEMGLYVEWSTNEKVSLEVAAAAAYSGLRALCTMKQVGVNVASDFLLHLAEYGSRTGLVLVTCEDPGSLSSTNEGDSRPYSKMMEFPLIEPGDIQEAKDMTRWAFELSETVRNVVMLRSVTRMSHASGNVTVGDLPQTDVKADFQCNGEFFDQMTGPVMTLPSTAPAQRLRQHEGLAKAIACFEESPFNTYTGPDRPGLLIITSSAATFYCREAIAILGIEERVGLLKLGTTWPLPPRLIEKHLATADRVLIVEEGTPFLEDNLKALFADRIETVGPTRFHGRADKTIPSVDELNPDIVMAALAGLLNLPIDHSTADYRQRISAALEGNVPDRAMTFCPGCPHRASFWLLHEALKLDNRRGFISGDIGCYTLGVADCGFRAVKTVAAMGSGVGMASGFGKLRRFGLEQPVIAVCGDSTFFHAAMPGLVNAIHNQADMIMVILDNAGTAMTGFQPHPGIPVGADGKPLPALDIPTICQAMGARVEIADPFLFDAARKTIAELMDDAGGVRVLVLRQACALSPARKGKKEWTVSVDPDKCLGEACGCNRLCTRVFKCPGLIWDPEQKEMRIDEFVCVGCGVCAQVCPQNAITVEKVVNS